MISLADKIHMNNRVKLTITHANGIVTEHVARNGFYQAPKVPTHDLLLVGADRFIASLLQTTGYQTLEEPVMDVRENFIYKVSINTPSDRKAALFPDIEPLNTPHINGVVEGDGSAYNNVGYFCTFSQTTPRGFTTVTNPWVVLKSGASAFVDTDNPGLDTAWFQLRFEDFSPAIPMNAMEAEKVYSFEWRIKPEQNLFFNVDTEGPGTGPSDPLTNWVVANIGGMKGLYNALDITENRAGDNPAAWKNNLPTNKFEERYEILESWGKASQTRWRGTAGQLNFATTILSLITNRDAIIQSGKNFNQTAYKQTKFTKATIRLAGVSETILAQSNWNRWPGGAGNTSVEAASPFQTGLSQTSFQLRGTTSGPLSVGQCDTDIATNTYAGAMKVSPYTFPAVGGDVGTGALRRWYGLWLDNDDADSRPALIDVNAVSDSAVGYPLSIRPQATPDLCLDITWTDP
ncbi:hypothetical protein [Candidatus Poriferisocius sp.]|uniref:hypothetical protein n=1 Tax=Candidatus Poriferisocius sp. TaxID=3101276 RepID=UPI003B52DA99